MRNLSKKRVENFNKKVIKIIKETGRFEFTDSVYQYKNDILQISVHDYFKGSSLFSIFCCFTDGEKHNFHNSNEVEIIEHFKHFLNIWK